MSDKLIRINQSSPLSAIAREVWQEKLVNAAFDASVRIRHAEVQGDEAYRIHVAAIGEKVGAHYHKIGDEDYAVVSGQGTLFYAPIIDGEPPEVPRRLAVKTGDHFIIPQGYAHQLKNTGNGDLVILFGCPDAHLDDEQDRYMLDDLAL